LNNLIDYNYFNNVFAGYYGFTQEDVEQLFVGYGIAEEDKKKACDWYDGYKVKIDPKLKIYNPWSIVNYLNRKEIQNYWVESGNIDFIKKIYGPTFSRI
jgi:hypothetical protein